MKLMIAIPCTEYMHYRFAECLAALCKHLQENPSIEYGVEIKGATLVSLGREQLVNRALGKGYTHVLWLDCDMIFDEYLVDNLLEAMREHNCELAAGIFRSRHGECRPTLFEKLCPDERITEFPDEPFEIEGCGMACVLMTTNLLQKILDSDGTTFMPTVEYSEDLAFCYRCKEHEVKMIGVPKAKVGHITQGIIWPDKSHEFI